MRGLLIAVLVASSPAFADEQTKADPTGSGYDGTRAGRTPPRLRARHHDVQGELDRETIRRVIRKRLEPIRKCMRDATVTRKGMRVVWRIEVDGTVSHVEVKGLGARADACVAAELRSMRFGPVPGVVTVSYPMSFTR